MNNNHLGDLKDLAAKGEKIKLSKGEQLNAARRFRKFLQEMPEKKIQLQRIRDQIMNTSTVEASKLWASVGFRQVLGALDYLGNLCQFLFGSAFYVCFYLLL